MPTVSERKLEKGTEVDIGSAHATKGSFGRLTIRKNGSDYEIYDLDDNIQVDWDTNLEALVGRANDFTTMTVSYSEGW